MSEQKQQPIISIDHVSMRFNLAKEKHESLKEYFVALCTAVCDLMNSSPFRMLVLTLCRGIFTA